MATPASPTDLLDALEASETIKNGNVTLDLEALPRPVLSSLSVPFNDTSLSMASSAADSVNDDHTKVSKQAWPHQFSVGLEGFKALALSDISSVDRDTAASQKSLRNPELDAILREVKQLQVNAERASLSLKSSLGSVSISPVTRAGAGTTRSPSQVPMTMNEMMSDGVPTLAPNQTDYDKPHNSKPSFYTEEDYKAETTTRHLQNELQKKEHTLEQIHSELLTLWEDVQSRSEALATKESDLEMRELELEQKEEHIYQEAERILQEELARQGNYLEKDAKQLQSEAMGKIKENRRLGQSVRDISSANKALREKMKTYEKEKKSLLDKITTLNKQLMQAKERNERLKKFSLHQPLAKPSARPNMRFSKKDHTAPPISTTASKEKVESRQQGRAQREASRPIHLIDANTDIIQLRKEKDAFRICAEYGLRRAKILSRLANQSYSPDPSLIQSIEKELQTLDKKNLDLVIKSISVLSPTLLRPTTPDDLRIIFLELLWSGMQVSVIQQGRIVIPDLFQDASRALDQATRCTSLQQTLDHYKQNRINGPSHMHESYSYSTRLLTTMTIITGNNRRIEMNVDWMEFLVTLLANDGAKMLYMSYNGMDFTLAILQRALLAVRSQQRASNAQTGTSSCHMDVIRLSCTIMLHLASDDYEILATFLKYASSMYFIEIMVEVINLVPYRDILETAFVLLQKVSSSSKNRGLFQSSTKLVSILKRTLADFETAQGHVLEDRAFIATTVRSILQNTAPIAKGMRPPTLLQPQRRNVPAGPGAMPRQPPMDDTDSARAIDHAPFQHQNAQHMFSSEDSLEMPSFAPLPPTCKK